MRVVCRRHAAVSPSLSKLATAGEDVLLLREVTHADDWNVHDTRTGKSLSRSDKVVDRPLTRTLVYLVKEKMLGNRSVDELDARALTSPAIGVQD